MFFVVCLDLFVHSFNICTLNTCMPSTGDSAVTKADKVPAFEEFTI